MKEIRYHTSSNEVNYCLSTEIPSWHRADFEVWMSDNNYHTLRVDEVPDEPVYKPSHIRGYLDSKGFKGVEVIEDQGHLTRDIARGVEIKLEIMD